jgi:hypothetical protein
VFAPVVSARSTSAFLDLANLTAISPLFLSSVIIPNSISLLFLLHAAPSELKTVARVQPPAVRPPTLRVSKRRAIRTRKKMILLLEIETIKAGLGKNRTGAEITLADAQRPRCCVPFSYYITDVPAFEDAHKVKLDNLKFKPVQIECTQMQGMERGIGIKLEGAISLPSK